MFQQVLNQRWRMLNRKTKMSATVGTVQLKKVAQSLIKGPILTSEASPCFIVPFIIKLDSNDIKIHALLNSRASAKFH
jgi:hypothetical protein